LTIFKASYRPNLTNADITNNEFGDLLYSLLMLGVSERLEGDVVVEFLQQLLGLLDCPSHIPSLLTDLLLVIDADISCSDSKSQKKHFINLVSSLVCIIGEDLLKERLDMDTLELAGLIPSKSNYNQKYVKTKTKLFYKQQKFNLYREESEGYSKLISELGHESLIGVPPNKVLDSIKSLIGRFSLDPNRVLDVILQVFECHLQDKAFFVSLLKLYPCDVTTFINILGFKYHTYHQVEGDQSKATPSSLYKLTAILLQAGLIELELLAPHLSLSDDELQDLHKSIMEIAQSIVKKATIVSLVDKTDEEKEKELKQTQIKKEEQLKLLSTEYNQILGVCHGCLLEGDWAMARRIIDGLPSHIAMGCPIIVDALCQMLNYLVEPIYRQHAPRGTTSTMTYTLPVDQCHTFDDLLPTAVEMCYTLGPQLYTHPVLLCKIIRVIKAYLKLLLSSNTNDGQIKALTPELMENVLLRWFITIIDRVILPSLSLLHCNCGMAEEVWSMLRLLPYETR
jgi:THO complex subunit 2